MEVEQEEEEKRRMRRGKTHAKSSSDPKRITRVSFLSCPTLEATSSQFLGWWWECELRDLAVKAP